DSVVVGSGYELLPRASRARFPFTTLFRSIYIVDNLGDQVIENAGEGQDTVLVTVSGYTLADNVEIGAVNTTSGLTLNANPTQGSVLFGNTGDATLNDSADDDPFAGDGGND